jgi:hypothetical protein
LLACQLHRLAGMKLEQVVGGFVVAFAFLTSRAHAQSAEPGAGSPASAPAAAQGEVSAAPPASGASPESPSSLPPPATAGAAEPAPPTVAALPASPPTPAPPLLNVPAAPLALGATGETRDAPAARASGEPIRAQRKLALLGEIGWNSLGGWGLLMTYNAHPHLALDLAGGFSMTGWKAGLRGRYNLLKGPFTPFIGAGLSLSSGWDGVRIGGGRERDRSDRDDFDFDPSEEAKYDVKRSAFAQAVVGFEFIHRHGFTMQATAGYSRLLNDDNYNFRVGKRDDDLASALFGSGPVVSLAFGYAFD